MATDREAQGREALPLDARLSQVLVREIIAGRYPPGSWIREQEVSDRHKVSRASVREALRNVAYAGFVDIQPWRGAQVAQIGKPELLDIFRLLELTYGQCAYRAATCFPEALLPELREKMAEMERALAAGASQRDLDTLSFGIGQMVGRNSGSKLAYRLLVQVGNLALWQQRVLLPGTPQISEQSGHAHHMLINAVGARDPEVAEAAARMIVMLTRQALEQTEVAEPAKTVAPPRTRKARKTPT